LAELKGMVLRLIDVRYSSDILLNFLIFFNPCRSPDFNKVAKVIYGLSRYNKLLCNNKQEISNGHE
jgi:hypothetical protein